MALFDSRKERDRKERKAREERRILENNNSHPSSDEYAKKARDLFSIIQNYISPNISMRNPESIQNFYNYMTKNGLYSDWTLSYYSFYTLTEQKKNDDVEYWHSEKRVSLLTKEEQKQFLLVLSKIFEKLRMELADKNIVLDDNYKSEINILLSKIIYELQQSTKKINDLYEAYNKIVDFEKKLQNELDSERNTFNIAGQAQKLFSMNRTSKDISELQNDLSTLNTLSSNIDMMIKMFQFMEVTNRINPQAYCAILHDLTKAIIDKKSYVYYLIKESNNIVYLTSKDNKYEIDLSNYSGYHTNSLKDVERLIQIVGLFLEKIQEVDCVQDDTDCRSYIEELAGSKTMEHIKLVRDCEDEKIRLKFIKDDLAVLLSSLTQDRLLDAEIAACGKSIKVSMLKLMDEIQRGNARRKLGGITDNVIAPSVKHVMALDDALEKTISALKAAMQPLDIKYNYAPAEKATIDRTISLVQMMEKHSVLERDIEKDIEGLIKNLNTWYAENINKIFREKLNPSMQTFKNNFSNDIGKLGEEFGRFDELHRRMNASLSKLMAIAKDTHTSTKSLKDLLQTELDELSALRTLSKDILATLFKITNDLKDGVNSMRAKVN